MAKKNFELILVVGENHKEIAEKYSADTKVSEYLKMEHEKAELEQKNHLKFLESILTDKRLELEESFFENLKKQYINISQMTPFEYFKYMTKGCTYEIETVDAYSTENPNSFYKYEVCKQANLEKHGIESDFSDPFILKDGTKSYSAHVNDIDWSIKHLNEEKIFLYDKIWSLVVDGVEPQTEEEKQLKNMFFERKYYFSTNFSSKEEYLAYNCCAWFDGIATEKSFNQLDFHMTNYDWYSSFFEMYITPLKESNPLLTIYEARPL